MKKLFALAALVGCLGFIQNAQAQATNDCYEFYFEAYYYYYATEWNCAAQGQGAMFCYGSASYQAAQNSYYACLYY